MDKSNAFTGDTPKNLQISITLNCLVSNSCASAGFTVIGWKSILPSNTATPLGVPVVGLKAVCQLVFKSTFCLPVKVDCTFKIPAKLAPPLKNPCACDSESVASPKVCLACSKVLIPVIPL